MKSLLNLESGTYQSPPRRIGVVRAALPTASFYSRFIADVCRSSACAKRGLYDAKQWSRSSHGVLQALESVGVRFEISGAEHLQKLSSPCVFVGNHMSMLETMVLPCIVCPFRNLTFVVKDSLLTYPVFKHILNARNPIGVSRTNPREDLKAVLGGGCERLQNGTSIVVFPQTTRSQHFDSAQFNSIGSKLAKRANVPIIPIALKTDAWGNGKRLKDFGRIVPDKMVRFAFGEPIDTTTPGSDSHQRVIEFIESKVSTWN